MITTESKRNGRKMIMTVVKKSRWRSGESFFCACCQHHQPLLQLYICTCIRLAWRWLGLLGTKAKRDVEFDLCKSWPFYGRIKLTTITLLQSTEVGRYPESASSRSKRYQTSLRDNMARKGRVSKYLWLPRYHHGLA